ncbi:Serine/threonine-protein kinase haspin-like-like protein [Cladobotryum mycophilum]|uniref:non-specific serine/threonine protein kinase n=1 Tax=Cladobotryum mycophilum TaxID=491253 RepID=A0ABR0SEH8_9HYPO
MARTTTKRQYGKPSKRTKAERLFAELPQSPIRKPVPRLIDDEVSCLTAHLSTIQLGEVTPQRQSARLAGKEATIIVDENEAPQILDENKENDVELATVVLEDEQVKDDQVEHKVVEPEEEEVIVVEEPLEAPSEDNTVVAEPEESTELPLEPPLRVLTWGDVCPPTDKITKIAEASYAEVYRVTNERGVSIIKVIRLQSPIKAQTKAQVKSGLVDEEPHPEEDLNGELQISEWLADIPGFVIYKERYIVQGKTTKPLLETHQAFQKKMKKEDPGRAQFYPSPSRYLDDTRFMVVELGDAGTALEDWQLANESQLWDIFLLEAIALARAEELAMFEHRDLHEGNVCIKQVRPPRERDVNADGFFGYSGLEITILDYGLSRAEDLTIDDAIPVAFDLERDLSLFTSTHAEQCKVYRQMRSFLLRADRKCLPPEAHDTPYAKGIDGPLDWKAFAPYTNVLWLAYLYEYIVEHYKGGKKELTKFKKETAELWTYLNPDAPDDVPCFGCAADVVCFAFESGWIREDQLQGASASMIEREDSIIVSRDDREE